MTTFTPICSYCTHFNTEVRDREVCAAFPDGIPRGILTSDLDHREPIEGDHNIQFDPVEGFEYVLGDDNEPEPETLAAKHPPTAVHTAADSFIQKVSTSIRYAFAKGREAINHTQLRSALTKAEAEAATRDVAGVMEKELKKVLPKVVAEVVSAGGEAGLLILRQKLRLAGGPGSGNFGHAGRPGEVGGSEEEFRDLAPQVPGQPHTVLPPFNLAFNVTNPAVKEWIAEHTGDLIKGITDTTKQDIKDAIERAYEGGNLEEAYDEILDAVGNAERADMIARTETMAAANGGQREAWDQAVEAGLLTGGEKRQWIATDDKHLCGDCEDLDGETIEFDAQYPETEHFDPVDGPPLHPNCRCTEGIVY